MAEVVLCPLLQVIFEKLTSQLMKIITRISHGFKEEIEKLEHTLQIIQAVLEDAEERQVKEKAMKIWLTELKEVAYDADNLIDEIYKSVTRTRTSIVRIPSNIEFFPKLKEIRGRLDMLAVQRHNFNLKEGFVKRECDVEGRRQTGSFVIESEVFGREEDKQAIIELLLLKGEGGVQRDISVVSIVGLGGLGKTTLAQLVYNDERVEKSFDLKIWVCVNQEFNVRMIMKLIIESITKHKCDFLGMDVLQSQLRRLLHGKRYLLVLDDVWNEDQDEWDKLRISLSDCAKGSKVIITTRNTKVALIVGTIPPYCLKGLSHDDCWALFKQRAFACGEGHPNLLAIGREMVKKCGGLPLAAKALGSLMRFKREEWEWLHVLESDLWNECEGESGILPALRLSYSHLPSHLKCCFTYCSVFPKNYVIKKDDLVQLWIAEGLIKSNDNARQSVEETGNDFFNNLMWMFFFQNVNKVGDGCVTECKMHDLVHDLAQSIAGDEFIILEHGRLPRHLAQIRHSSVVCGSELHTIPESLYEAKKLRTLNLLFPRGNLGEVPPNLFSSFRYMRALNLSGSGIKRLHNSVSCLIFLRYLNISNTLIETLPESIGDLDYLQVLNLAYCYDLIELPMSLTRLRKLRRLMINGCDKLSHLPDRIGNLIQLQTLPTFIVGTGNHQGLTQLHRLPLVGELNIRQLENANSRYDRIMVNLRMKPKLRSLGLSWRNNHDDLIMRNNNDSPQDEELLENLQPHRNLKRLSIEGYPGKYFTRWIGTPELPNLTNIVLIYCKRCEHLPALGELPFLKVIYMLGMPNVKNIGFYGRVPGRQFQSLQELSFIDFPNLEFWWSMNMKEEFPSLVKLTINKCPKLKNMPCFPSLKHLELRNCNEMILRSAANLSTLLNLVIDVFSGRLVLLESLLGNNPHLMSLTISSCTNLWSISSKLGGLVALKSLTIRWCEELISLPQEIQNLSSLESLEIIECHSLISLPEGLGGLTSLRSLSIENCNNITSLPMGLQHLTALEHLTLMYCPSLASLPANFRNLSMLKSLYILNCPELSCLPEELQYVKTLQNLEIHSCRTIKDFPAWIGSLSSLTSLVISDCCNIISLPEGLQHLINLQHLSIRECPRLENRCKKYTGEDWPKVAHIPHIYIGSTEPRQYDGASSSSH
ncbi:hypothetical protein Ddye_006544 [Dipteronia dyeriana]|uniref:Disease resistance protein RGA3 n=1 Tax=Dipteronia dyeriana TaxID=168575 RepID=A0AAE0CQU1_9ROSI|nr:hypothetical protein Ddye_006544 [Dipteronia dyeriana]